ncbi:hypothetical protein QUC31_005709 [Theobroma cacao]
MAKDLRVKILEHCQVSPPPDSVNPQTSLIPLTFFDVPWLFFAPTQPLFFYPYPYSTSHFLSATLPTLKQSLSLTLQHFFPFAGHLVLDSKSNRPKIVYNEKHSFVSLTFAESNADFHYISGDRPRDVEEFHPLVPSLERSLQSSDDENEALPLLAVKVTVFPNSGLCIGLAYHHVAADGRTFDNFIKTWASFHKDSSFLITAMPSYDRTLVIDKHGLEAIFLKEWRKKKSAEHEMVIVTKSKAEFSNKVRATFVMGLTEMEKIKRWIVTECKKKNLREPVHLSPYVVTCAFVWGCLMKAACNEGVADKCPNDYPSYLGFNAGGLSRFDCRVPSTYFGNCVGFGRCEATRGDLMGENGIILAAKAIGDTVKKLDKALLGEAERWISDWEVFYRSEPHMMVVGSPKVHLYETDFGWGRPNKIEEISIDQCGAISLTESRCERGGIEVGLALPKPQMDTFTSLFDQGLKAKM